MCSLSEQFKRHTVERNWIVLLPANRKQAVKGTGEIEIFMKRQERPAGREITITGAEPLLYDIN
jgi:hypothetical protein